MRDSSEIYLNALKRKLEIAAELARPLAIAGDFEGAERAIYAVDGDIYGRLAAAQLYLSTITALGGAAATGVQAAKVRALFDRAVSLRENAFPTPHTEDEAESYDTWSKLERGRVVEELGFDPHK